MYGFYTPMTHYIRYQPEYRKDFITVIMTGKYGDVWDETLTQWSSWWSGPQDKFEIKPKIVSELQSNPNMKREIIEKAVNEIFFWEGYDENDQKQNAKELKKLTEILKRTFDAILYLLELKVESIDDTLKAWNYIKDSKYLDIKKTIKEDVDIQRVIVKRISDSFIQSPDYTKKLEVWVATESNKEKKNVKRRIVDDLKNDVEMSIDVIAYTIKQTDMQDDNYADMYEHNSVFDQVFFYIFNSIATVLAKGATNTRSAWTTLKNNENEKIHGVYCFNVKAAITIIQQETAIQDSDPIEDSEDSDPIDPLEWQHTHTAALLRLLQSHISL
jgi:hypothetical protein